MKTYKIRLVWGGVIPPMFVNEIILKKFSYFNEIRPIYNFVLTRDINEALTLSLEQVSDSLTEIGRQYQPEVVEILEEKNNASTAVT